MAENKDQHFLPISYLRGFAFDYPTNLVFKRADLKTFVFYRDKMSVRKKGLLNVAKESYLYSFVLADGSYDHYLEYEFSKFEPKIIDMSNMLYDELIINRKLKSEILHTAEFKNGLAYSIALQFKRTPKMKRNIEEHISKSILINNPIAIKNLGNSILGGLGEKKESDLPSFSDAFLKKNWLLFAIINDERRFVTTDLPVSLFNNDGIGNEETEIWYPINEKILLVMHGLGNGINIKQLHHENSAIIRKLNEGMAKLAENLIISSNDKLLQSLGNNVMQWKYQKNVQKVNT